MKSILSRKLTPVALASVMSVSAFAGFAGEVRAEESTDKTVLKVAAFNGGNGEQIWKDIEEAFEKEHEDVDVELKLSSELNTDLTKDIKNKKYPDVVYYNLGQSSAFTENMLKEEAVADISDVFDDELRERLLDGILEGTDAQPYGDGKIYLAPIFYTPTGLWYNRNLFEGDNKKYDLPSTWEEFFALGDKAKEEGVALFTFPTSGYLDTTMFTMLEQAGGQDYYNAALKYDAETWTSDAGKKVLDTLSKLVSAEYTQEDTVANANADGGFKINQQNVIDGKALFMPNGSWVIGEMAASTPEDYAWGMMPAPKWEGDETQAVYMYTEQMWIPKDAPNLDLAKEFVKFMYSDTVVDILLNNTSLDKETGKELPAPVVAPVKGAAEKLPEGITKDVYAATTADNIVSVTGTWTTTQPIEGLDVKKNIFGTVESINTGDMTVEEWQQLLVDTWEECAANLE